MEVNQYFSKEYYLFFIVLNDLYDVKATYEVTTTYKS